jgi:hypothetical protein
MRRAAKVDGNHRLIATALRAVGATVQSLAALGDGVPDLLVGRGGQSWLLEVKDPAQAPSKRRLTPAQLEWRAAWRGVPVVVVETPEEALRASGVGR